MNCTATAFNSTMPDSFPCPFAHMAFLAATTLPGTATFFRYTIIDQLFSEVPFGVFSELVIHLSQGWVREHGLAVIEIKCTYTDFFPDLLEPLVILRWFCLIAQFFSPRILRFCKKIFLDLHLLSQSNFGEQQVHKNGNSAFEIFAIF